VTTVTFYDVKNRKKVEVPVSDVKRTSYKRTTADGKVQVRYALRAKVNGMSLTKFVSQPDWEKVDAPME
jgi:hypothetical protein